MSEKDISKINIIYQINKKNKKDINIFGNKFVENNKNICKMIIDNKEYEICRKFNIKGYNKNKLEIKLKGIDNINTVNVCVVNFLENFCKYESAGHKKPKEILNLTEYLSHYESARHTNPTDI